VKCWGDNGDSGVLEVPDGLKGRVYNIMAGYYHNCAILMDSRVVCWGKNKYKQVEIGRAFNTSHNDEDGV